MTEITERRLKCDYCGNVSPVMEGDEMPRGWVVRGTNWGVARLHFCTEAHIYIYMRELEQFFNRASHPPQEVELIE